MKKIFSKFLSFFFIISCEKHCELDSATYDRTLTTWEKIARKVHSLHCLFCRRFHKQINVVEQISKADKLATYSSSQKMSLEQKQAIAKNLSDQV